MIYPMPIIIRGSGTPMTITQVLLAVGIAIPIGLIMWFFIEHDMSDVKDWFKDKFRNKKEKK